MIKTAACVIFLLAIVVKSDEDYIDPVIEMLLNGVRTEITQSGEDLNERVPVSTGGIWKCGNCTFLGEAELVHSELNQVDPDMDMEDVQISLSLEDMRCVTVAADRPGAVRNVHGPCIGSTVTLSLSPSHNFTIFVYK